MNTVYLYGSLAEKFGESFEFEISSAREAVSALMANLPGFADELRHGNFHVIVGSSVETGVALDIEGVAGFNIEGKSIFILPEVEGAKRGGLGKIIFGIALIGLSAMTGGAAGALMGQALWGGTNVGMMVGSIGTSMVLTGVASLLAPETDASADDNKSFTMAGPQSSTREGGIIPIIYGEVYTGPMLISGGISISTGDKDEEAASSGTSAGDGSYVTVEEEGGSYVTYEEPTNPAMGRDE
jgi:predicted phage tail protein